MHKITLRAALATTALCGLGLYPVSAFAQDASDPFPDDGSQSVLDDNGEILVIAPRSRGSVDTDVPAVIELNAEDIASYGVSSVGDLVAALSSQTTSSRGRGSGRPIILINGQRTSGFREIRDLPPEAIQNVEVFPEEVALQYGYRPDQRVINFILKDNYTGFNAEIEYGVPTAGDYTKSEIEGTFTRIGKNSRINLDLEYNRETAITEAERDIIQDDAGALVGLGDFRTLAAPSDNVEFNSNYSRTFGNGTVLSLNGAYTYNETRGLLGLPSANLDLPDGDTLFRYFTQYGALEREIQTDTAQVGAALNGSLADWRWSLTADYDSTLTNTATERSGDAAALQAAITAGTADPLATDFGTLLDAPTTDTARSLSQTLNSLATMSGTVLVLPSGPVTTTFRGGYNRQDLNSRSVSSGIETQADLGRDIYSTGFNIDIPLADENYDVAETIGKLSINGNIGASSLSDFGSLLEFGFGLNWEPFDGFTITASAIGEEAAPTIQQLGNPLVITPDANIFDFTNNQSELITITTGGNPALIAEKRRDIKLAISYRPEWLDGLTFLSEYFRNNSDNVASSFPLLTPEIEAAFPDRVTRDGDGRLIALDRRPVSYSNVSSERIRYGLDFSKRFGERRFGGRGGGRGGPQGRGRPPANPNNEANPESEAQPAAEEQTQPEGRSGNATEGRQSGRPERAAGAGRGRPPGAGGRPPGGRWQASAYHTIRLEDKILIRPGVEELDLLNGSATGSTGGSPRHEFEVSGGWFNNGLGFRLDGKHQTATRVTGGLTGSDLRFSDLTTLNLRFFMGFDERGDLTEKLPFLKGARVSLRIDNIFNDIQDVRDSSGIVPLNYQRGFVDPIGRYIEIDFRKRF